ncbi:hypothetical protein Droror1_Dr00026946 [Drosera rotundifolia]
MPSHLQDFPDNQASVYTKTKPQAVSKQDLQFTLTIKSQNPNLHLPQVFPSNSQAGVIHKDAYKFARQNSGLTHAKHMSQQLTEKPTILMVVERVPNIKPTLQVRQLH